MMKNRRFSSTTGRTKARAIGSGRATAKMRPKNWASSSTAIWIAARPPASHGEVAQMSRSSQKALAAPATRARV